MTATQPNSCNTSIKGWQIVYVKGQIVNILGVMDQTAVSVETTQSCQVSTKEAIDST